MKTIAFAIVMFIASLLFAQKAEAVVTFKTVVSTKVGYNNNAVSVRATDFMSASPRIVQETLIPKKASLAAASNVSTGVMIYPIENGVPVTLQSCKITSATYTIKRQSLPSTSHSTYNYTSALPYSYYRRESDGGNGFIFMTSSKTSSVPISPSASPSGVLLNSVTVSGPVGALFLTGVDYNFPFLSKPSASSAGFIYKFMFKFNIQYQYGGVTTAVTIGEDELWSTVEITDNLPKITGIQLLNPGTPQQTEVISGIGKFMPLFKLEWSSMSGGAWNPIAYTAGNFSTAQNCTWNLTLPPGHCRFFRLRHTDGVVNYAIQQ